MSLELSCHQRQALYSSQLNIIQEVKFTRREIDIIACILHNRGEKKIASLLLISPRTVSAHVHNIMLKLGINSKEHLIDFIEKSGKILLIKEYYLQLLAYSYFVNHLIKISKTINKQGITCIFSCKETSQASKKVINQLVEHLELANVRLIDADKAEAKDNHYMLTNELLAKQSYPQSALLIFEKNPNHSEYEAIEHMDFSKEENYYFTFFKLLPEIIKHPSLEQVIIAFQKECRTIENSWAGQPLSNEGIISFPYLLIREKLISNKFFLSLFLVSSVVSLAYFGFVKIAPASKLLGSEQIRADFPLPHQSILLQHTAILSKMDSKLAGKDDINVVALVGVGGSGKTTIARQYARNHNTLLIWEINSENKVSLISSFEQLAYSLSKTEEERQELAMLPQIKGEHEKERQLLLFITRRIKNYSSWLIIYNNVETFQDIQEYFPYDSKVWGKGKLIITTQDSNITRNSYILSDNAIEIGELSPEEKLELFTKITNPYTNSLNKQQSEIIDFLEKIPSFPLDVSIAAYYLKEEKISYSDYLKNLNEQEKEFVAIQETILKDIGTYNKTRYDIITLPINRIIESQPHFQDLLLLVSMINSENIPRSLLEKYKGSAIASKFLHELKKYSLITEKHSTVNQAEMTFSIHRSTQTIALTYLAKLLQLKQGIKQLQDISLILESSLDNELKNLKQTAMLVAHVEAFLKHDKLLSRIDASKLKVKLGIYHFNNANYKKAESLLKEALGVYKEHYADNRKEIGLVATHLGSVYRNLGNYHEALQLFEEAYSIYKKNLGEQHPETAWISTYLGSIYRNLGNYQKSQELLENTIKIYSRNYDSNNIKIARVQAYLGSCYKNIGNYIKAKALLEKAFFAYKEYYGTNHNQTAWVSARLGNAYHALKEYDQAKHYLEQSLNIYQKLYGKNCIETAWSLTHLASIYMSLGNSLKAQESLKESLDIYTNYLDSQHVTIGWVLFNLGNAYKGLNKYDESKKALEQALAIYENGYGMTHIQTAGVINSLGEVNFLEGNNETAEKFFNKALTIYLQSKHPEMHITLENLADLYLKKSNYELQSGNTKKSIQYKEQSSQYLTQALEAVTDAFPAYAPIIERLSHKLKAFS